jgi:hypothetical protein
MLYIQQLLHNKIIGVAILSWAVAQIIKMIIDVIETKSVDLNRMFSSGGMPSSHTSFVTSLGFGVGFTYGFDSVYFSICFVLAMVVMYDAAGVRRAAGKQAAVLNILMERLEKTGIKLDVKLKELLGHTPYQVAGGAVLGFVMAFIFFILL